MTSKRSGRMAALSEIAWMHGRRRMRAVRHRSSVMTGTDDEWPWSDAIYHVAQRQARRRRMARKRRRGWA